MPAPANYKRPDFEKYAFEHTLSYQRRIAETKDSFMVRGKRTPLGMGRVPCKVDFQVGV